MKTLPLLKSIKPATTGSKDRWLICLEAVIHPYCLGLDQVEWERHLLLCLILNPDRECTFCFLESNISRPANALVASWCSPGCTCPNISPTFFNPLIVLSFTEKAFPTATPDSPFSNISNTFSLSARLMTTFFLLGLAPEPEEPDSFLFLLSPMLFTQ